MAKKTSATAELPPITEGTPPPLTQSTFEDWGRRLPIGVLQGGELHRAFAFRKYTMKEERELQGLRKKAKRMSLAAFVSEVLAKMLTQLGPHAEFQSLGENERQIIVSQLFMGDALYCYVMLRIDAMGETINFNLACPSCDHKWKAPANLLETDVKVAESPASLSRPYTMRDGVDTGEGSAIKTLVLQPPRWNAMSAVKQTDMMNTGEVKAKIITSSIRQVGAGKYPPTVEMLDTLTKYDLEKLTKEIDDWSPGPEMTLESVCPACSFELKHGLNWDWDFFFTAASL